MSEMKKILAEMSKELEEMNGFSRGLLNRFIKLYDKIEKHLGTTIREPKIPRPLQVSDFLDEFIDKLIEQLKSDDKRWGNTWLNRPKEGQELRTKARFTDYFDMFEEAGTPVPWMKIIGGALICWIREQHPELCIDANESKINEVEKLLNNMIRS